MMRLPNVTADARAGRRGAEVSASATGGDCLGAARGGARVVAASDCATVRSAGVRANANDCAKSRVADGGNRAASANESVSACAIGDGDEEATESDPYCLK